MKNFFSRLGTLSGNILSIAGFIFGCAFIGLIASFYFLHQFAIPIVILTFLASVFWNARRQRGNKRVIIWISVLLAIIAIPTFIANMLLAFLSLFFLLSLCLYLDAKTFSSIKSK